MPADYPIFEIESIGTTVSVCASDMFHPLSVNQRFLII